MGSFPLIGMKYDNAAFFQSLIMHKWDNSHWGTDESDDRFLEVLDMSSSQLGYHPVASEEHSAESNFGQPSN